MHSNSIIFMLLRQLVTSRTTDAKDIVSSKQTLKKVVNMGIFIPPKMIFDCFGRLAQPPSWHMMLGVIRARHYLWKRMNVLNTLAGVGDPRKERR